MLVDSHSPRCLNILPSLMGLREKNVTFVIDTSEGMYSVLGSVKHLLLQALVTKASLRDSLFNLIGFSHKVTKWHDCMVACGPDSVYEAQSWIHMLSCTPGRDLLGALAEAFADPFCQAIHLLTNDLPDNPDELLKEVLSVAKARPVHIFYLSDKGGPDHRTQVFLQCLSLSTRGRCYILSLSSTGAVEQARPLHASEYWTSVPYTLDVKYCSANGVLSMPASWDPHTGPCHHPCRYLNEFPLPQRWPLAAPDCTISTCGMWKSPLGTSQLYPGTRILAKRELDGFYYLGTIKQEVQGKRGVFLVQFDRSPGTACPCESPCLQHSSLLDIVPHAEAHQHSLLPGDKVLAPRDTQLRQYAPGSVLSGAELRDPLGNRNVLGLQVLFWNGQAATVPGDVAVWISPSLHERIVRELQRPLPAPCCRGDSCSVLWHRCILCCLPPTSPRICAHGQWWSLPASPCHISLRDDEGKKTREELERKVDLQLKELHDERSTPSPCSSHSSGPDDHADGAPKLEFVNQAVNTDLSLLYQSGPVPPARPDWKYWKRSHPEPQHKMPSGNTHQSTVESMWSEKHTTAEDGMSSVTNHSSLFQTVPLSRRPRSTVKDSLAQT